MADYLPPVVAKLEGDHAGLVRALRESKDKVRAWAADVGKTKATIQVDADLSRLDAKLQQAKNKSVDLKVKLDLAPGEVARLRQKVGSPPATMQVKLDLTAGTVATLRNKIKASAAAKLEVATALKPGTLAALRQEIRESPAAKLDTDLRLKTGALAAVRQRVKDATAAKLSVQLELDSLQATAIRAGLEANAIQLTVKPKMDQVAQRRVALILDELGRRVDVWIRPTMHRPSQVTTEARLARLARDRTATIRTVVISGGSSSSGRGGSGALKALLPLAPALAPIVASLTASTLNLAAALGAGAVATGVFGAAVIPQVLKFKDLTDAQSKATKATTKYGEASKQAADAQNAQRDALDSMAPATRRAAASWLNLRTDFTAWSDSLAKFTMRPVEKGLEAVDALLPKLSPLVKVTSRDVDRLMTLFGGEVNSPGFDDLMARFTKFTDGALSRGIDHVVHFSRVISEGDAKGPLADFMAYAEKEGPAVRETLENIGRAAVQISKGAGQAGPGILQLVNAAAKLVASLPPEVIARAMQLYTALKLIGLTKAGIMAVTGSVTSLATRLTAMRAASAAAGGGLAGVRAAIASLSTGAKVGGAIAVVAGVVLLMQKLSASGKKAPDVDKMTTAVGQFGRTGKTSGEMTRVFGSDLSGLGDAIDRVSGHGSGMDKFNDTMNKVFTLGLGQSNSMKEAKKDIDSIDKGLASLVQGGNASLAATAVAKLSAEMEKSGHPAKDLTDKLDNYQSALADARFEQQLTADSMGMFGQQSQAVQKTLDAQKQSADGLRQSIQALNDTNRAALSAQSDFEQAIDDATKAIKGHRTALRMVGGQLDLNSQKARDAYKPLTDLAASTDAAAAAARDQGKSWATVSGIYERGRDKLIATADAMGLTRAQAKKLADEILKAPNKTAFLKGDLSDLQRKLTQAKADLKAAPGSKKLSIRGDIVDLQNKIARAQSQINSVHGKTVHISVITDLASRGVGVAVPGGGRYATGAVVSGGVRKMADGGFGRPAMMARGGSNILWGEGPDESYIPHTRNQRSRKIAAETVGILGGSVSWGGNAGSPASAAAPLGAQVAKGLWAGMSGQAAWLAAQAAKFATQTIPEPMAVALGIKSPSRVAMALGRWVGHGLVQGLTGSTASVKAATLRLSRSIEQVFHDDAKAQLAADEKRLKALAGRKGKSAARERASLRNDIRQQQHTLAAGSSISNLVAKDNSKLLALAKQRDTVAGKLSAAQKKLSDLQKSWSSERNSIASGIMQNASIITDSPDGGRPVNANDVIAQLQQRVAAATQFAGELRQLQKMGLRSDLIQQLASAGVDSAGATVLALAGGSKSQIAQMNKLQAGLSSAANSTGSAVADAMYSAGIKSAQGLVKGLASQEKAINAQMLRIAKSMEAAIKKALGIHSPSTVMAQLGDYTAQGMAVGIHRSTKHAAIAAQGMAMAVRQGAALTALSGGGGGRGGDVHVHVTVHGSVTSERNLVETVRTGLLKGGLRNSNVGLTPQR